MDIKDLKDLGKFENEDFFNEFIENCEKSVIAAPENFAVSVMNKINAKKAARIIPFMSRKIKAAACFGAAFVIMTSTMFGFNNRIFDFISNVATPDKIEKIGEFFNILSKFKFN